MSIAVIYSSSTGNTKAVANYIADKTDGKVIDVSVAKKEDIESNDTIIFGSRVWAGKITKEMTAFIDANKDVLASKNVGLYLCCMYNGEKGQKQADNIAGSVGIKKYAFFNKGKKLVETGDEINRFISSL